MRAQELRCGLSSWGAGSLVAVQAQELRCGLCSCGAGSGAVVGAL